MPRNISENGLHFTAAFESFRAKAYKATTAEKYWTIGYGHYDRLVMENDTITEEDALKLLAHDMAKAVQAVDAAAAASLTQPQFDAVCDLVYNAGSGVIAASTGTGQALRRGDVAALRAKIALFINQNGKPLLGLRRRTAGRLALFDGMLWKQAEKVGRDVK
ncbi:endolysin [Pantoea phage AH01]|nr:endolysin [Pantoea phage AH01]